MADLYDAYPAAPNESVVKNSLITASPTPSPIAASIYDAYPAAPQQPTVSQPREATGAMESIKAGFQASAPGLAWRGKLPDLISNPEHSQWWERALTGITQVATELPIMAVGGAGGAIAGGSAGTAVAPGPGTAAGTVLGTGAGMFGLPAAMRQTLIEAYKAGDIKTGADYWNAFKEIAAVTAKESAIGAATMGAGGIVARAFGKAIAPAIGESISVGTGTKAIGAADVAAQIGTMVTIPAALQGRIPDAQEFLDAAIVIGGLKAAHPIAQRIVDTFVRTGRTPAEQVADAQADPEIAADLRKETPAPVNPEMTNRATMLAENRLTELAMKADTEQLTDAERAERVFLANNKAKPERLAEYYNLSPDIAAERLPLSKVDIQDGAQRVYADVLDQLRDVDLARRDAGRAPLGDDHAMAVAALVRARVVARSTRLGISPEELYATRRLQIVDEAQTEVKGDTPPEGAATFTPPEVDLFGNPVEVNNAPRHAVENLATQEVPLANLVLSTEVPQFKGQANDQGVIVPLGGSFDRTGVGPIQVWERKDGTLEVISGRHRLDLAKRTGEETIPAQIHREADGFTARMAATLDAQLNIREEQGNVADYAQYFKDAGITKEAADELGLLARAKGRTGFAIARDASPDLAAAHRAGQLSDEAAFSISAAAPGSERLQALGIAMVNEGKSALVAVNTMKAVELMAAEKIAEGKQGDIFGFDDSAMLEAAAMAKKATSIQRRISEQISAVSGASRRPELARKMGVDVADPEGIQKRIKELKQEQYLWDNWPIHPELVAQLRGEVPAPKASPPAKYSPEIQKKLDAAKLEHDSHVEMIKRSDLGDQGARLKGAGMRYAATKREITGELTVKEQAAKDGREAGNYIGKEVSVDGFDATVTANPFGKVTVQFADGTKRTVEADQIKDRPNPPTDDGILHQAETPAEGAARDREAALQALRKEGHEDPNILHQSKEPFYSELLRQIEARGSLKASPEQWKSTLKNLKGIKADEIKWSGVEEWLDAQPGPVPREAVLDFLRGNGVQVKEVVLGATGSPRDLSAMSRDELAALYEERIGYDPRVDDPGIATSDMRETLEEHMGEPDAQPQGGAKFSQYVLPGGENYRELLLTLPEKNAPKQYKWDDLNIENIGDGNYVVTTKDGNHRTTVLRRSITVDHGAGDIALSMFNQTEIRDGGQARFTSSHFDTPNILAHIRFNDRTDADGQRVLFLEEIQSDWAQKGKKTGFKGEESREEVQRQADPDRKRFYSGKGDMTDAEWAALSDRVRMWDEREHAAAQGIPKAPFVQKTEAWTGLALKRMIRYAAEHGYDRIAWTTGEQQVERYTSALRKAVDSIEWKKTEKGVQLVGYKNDGRPVGPAIDAGAGGVVRPTVRDPNAGRTKVVDTTEQENALSDAIGKAMAEKIIKDPAQEGTIEGDNIRIDSTGMASFYDRILPNVANDLLKKLGGEKVGTTKISELPRAYLLKFADGPYAGEIYQEGPTAEPLSFRTENEARHYARDNNMPPMLVEKNAEALSQASFDVTPAMKAKALEGLPLFQQKQAENRGSYDIAENLIKTLEGADRSTVVHELGHSWLEEMKADAQRPDAPAQIKADWDILRRELAIPESGTIERTSHEQFARSVERYLMEGEAPSPELRSIFAQFKQWLLDIYKSVMALKVDINPELKGVLDRMLAVEQDAKDAAELNVPRAYVAEARATEAAKIVPPEGVKKAPGFKDEQLALEPYADELLTGPGSGATNDSRVNAQYINGPMDFKLAIQQMANRDQPNIQAARGGQEGVKSWEQANAEVDRLAEQVMGGKMSDNLFHGDPNAPSHDIQQRYAFRVMMAITQYSLKLRDAVLERGPNATVQDQFDYLSSIVRMRMAHAEFLGLRAASARALNQIRDMTPESGAVEKMIEATAGDGRLFQGEKTPAEQAAELETKLKELMAQHFSGKGALDIAKLHKDIKGLKGNLQLAKAVTDATKWEMVVEGWKSGLLSGPVTHTTNIFGTEAFFSLRPAVDLLAAVIGIARGASPGMGETDRASMSEAVARLTGMISGVKDGLKVFGASFMADEATQKTESYRTAIPGRAGQIIRTPLRLMGAADDMNQTIYRRGELKTLAIRQAFDENLNPNTRAFSDRVEFLVDNPTPEITTIAEEAGARMSFNAPLGEKGIALQLFVQKWNLQWMIPFIRTPINIAKELARMSPFSPLVGEWRAAVKKGGVERDRALAEMALGTGIMALTIGYAFGTDDKGRKLITGAGSPDPGKNRSKAGVEQPYSVLVGDTYYEYARIAPTGTLIGLAADVANVWDHLDDEEKDQIPKMLAVAFSNAVTNQTFLQGITNFVNATSDPTRFAPRFLQQLAASTVPNIIGQPTAMADPVVRQVNSALEAVYARLPGFREQLEPKVDWLGQDVKTKERLGVIGPSRTLDVTEDKVRLEAARLDLSLADAPKKTHIGKGTGKLGDVELTPEERTKYAKVGGEMAHKILTEIVAAPGYDAIPDLIKKKMFRQVLTATHRLAAVQALPMDKRMAHLSEITERLQQELAPGGEQ